MVEQYCAFGYFDAGRTREVLRLTHDGFIFNGKTVFRWSEIVGYRAFPDFYPDRVMIALASPKPKVSLYANDGRIIRIRGDLLVREGSAMIRRDGIPEAFNELVTLLRDRGVSRWMGPKEEYVLLSVAAVLFMLGFALAFVLVDASVFESRIAAAVMSGVLLAQLAFMIAPLLARLVRRLYIGKHGASIARQPRT